LFVLFTQLLADASDNGQHCSRAGSGVQFDQWEAPPFYYCSSWFCPAIALAVAKTVAQIYQSALLVGLGLIILAILGALIGRIVRRGNISLVVSAS
jgi:hypothetical protein